MKEMPVTISAFSIGMFVTPIITVRPRFLIFEIAMQAMVPRMTAMTEERTARAIVVRKAWPISASVNNERYHLRVKPPQRPLLLLTLND